MPVSTLRVTTALAIATAAVCGVGPAPARAADEPETVVTMGDSYISGEAGRWAGNSNKSYTLVDAGGSSAYHDNLTRTAETINRCHRSTSAPAHLGGGLNSVNLACSGATAATRISDGYFKPGLDFFDDGAGKVGQAKLLQQVASSTKVTAVAVTVGGNDFTFDDVIATCISNFLGSSSLYPNYCSDDASVAAHFSPGNMTAVRAGVVAGLQNIRTAMRNAGYTDGSWKLIVMNYPQPLPKASDIRYSQSGFTRQSTGGCGFWNRDADWASDTALAAINSTLAGAVADAGITGTVTVDMSQSMVGRRLCDKGVGLVESQGLTSWRSTGAVDRSEWVNQVRTASTAVGQYYLQESLHPNHWGQLAQRNCLRQAYSAGTGRSGRCVRSGTGLVAGEPAMTLQ